MARQPINHGTSAGDGTGESLFDAFQKVNANETELYAAKTESYANFAAFPVTGEALKEYVAVDTGARYLWDSVGAAYQAVARLSTDSNGNTVLVDAAGNVLIRPVVSYTWANRPAAAANTGVVIRITDIGGTAGSRWISDGTYWKPEAGIVTLANSGVAVTCPVNATENVLATVSIPGLLMATGGTLRLFMSASWTNSANNKIWRVRLGGIAGTIYQVQTVTTTLSGRFAVDIQNRGATNSQIGGCAPGNGTFAIAGSALVTSAIDTAADTTLVITGQKALDSESFVLERFTVEMINP